MLFVATGKVRAGTTRERVGRRTQWDYPPGLKVIGEYWVQSPDPNVITICEADSVAPIIAATSDWDDVMSWTVLPAISAQEGLEMAKQMA